MVYIPGSVCQASGVRNANPSSVSSIRRRLSFSIVRKNGRKAGRSILGIWFETSWKSNLAQLPTKLRTVVITSSLPN